MYLSRLTLNDSRVTVSCVSNPYRFHHHLLMACGSDPRMRFVFEDPLNGETTASDVPVSFAERRFQVRRLRTEFIEFPPGSGG